MSEFLPTNKKEMLERGWNELDVIFITADAYCDHPSFGVAILSRLLESEGFRVGVIAQPDWQSDKDFLKLGRPKLFFGVTAGNLDSMLNIYTSYLNRRMSDKYSPGNTVGLRPKLPTIVYTNRVKKLFSGVPVVIGGIEASLRRLAYYDFWSDKVRRSILFDSKADILVYGMGEHQVLEISRRLQSGETTETLCDIRGTVIARRTIDFLKDFVMLPAYQDVVCDKWEFIDFFNLYSGELNPLTARAVVQKTDDRFCIQLPPVQPLTQEEMDRVYGLNYTRRSHPAYEKSGGIAALKTVRDSIVSHRGCAATCSFCSLSLHQGRFIQSRSIDSIVGEARVIAKNKNFKSVISDVGGPTANMYGSSCLVGHKCSREDCLWPAICHNFKQDFKKQIKMLKSVASVNGIRQVNIQSGVRYDLLLLADAKEYLRLLCKKHVSGRLKVAPEHVSERVLALMRKPSFKKYLQFVKKYEEINKDLKKDQFLVQYFVTSHPGCGFKEAQELTEYLKRKKCVPLQIQDFIPLPMTRSACMYYTGMDPATGKSLFVAKKRSERMNQRRLIQP